MFRIRLFKPVVFLIMAYLATSSSYAVIWLGTTRVQVHQGQSALLPVLLDIPYDFDTIVAVSSGTNGTTEILTSPHVIRFTPNPSFLGTIGFSYQVTGNSGFGTGDVEVTVLPGVCTNPFSVNVSPTSGLVVTEAGGSDTFTVSLSSAPTGTVTIPLSTDNSEASLSHSQLIFTPTNWGPITVTVTGRSDGIFDGDISFLVVLGNTSSTSNCDPVLNPADVSVTCIDENINCLSSGSGSGDPCEELMTNGFAVICKSPSSGSVQAYSLLSEVNEPVIFSIANDYAPASYGGDEYYLEVSQIPRYAMVAADSKTGEVYFDWWPEEGQVGRYLVKVNLYKGEWRVRDFWFEITVLPERGEILSDQLTNQ